MTVELHCAWVWDCDECGAENFERTIEGDLVEAAMAQSDDQESVLLFQAEEAMSEAVDGDADLLETPQIVAAIAIAPKTVICRACGTTHFTEIHTIKD